MFHFHGMSDEAFRERAQVPDAEEKKAIRARLCRIVNAPEDAVEGVVSPLLYAKTEILFEDISAVPEFSLTKTMEQAGFSPTEQLIIFESQMSGLAGIFLGQRILWFDNLVEWIGGGEDVAMISEDYASIAVLTHYRMLRFGDLTIPGFRDPEWVKFAVDEPKRAATNQRLREIIVAKKLLG